MAICGCSTGGFFVSAVVALLLLPAQYYVPDLYLKDEKELEVQDASEKWFQVDLQEIPALDIFVAGLIVVSVVAMNFCEWVQMRTMERKIAKLNQYLTMSVERLRAMDAQQDELETTLKMVHNATSEYNLLLYLLLREQRMLRNGPLSNCFFDKAMDADIDNLTLV